MSTPTRRVTIKPVRPARPAIHAELAGDDQLTGGVGNWDILDRPRRRQAVEWTGTSNFTYALTLLLDGMEVRPGHDVSVEAQCRALQQWASKPTQLTDEPCVVQLRGPLQTPDSLRWVITGLDWGAKIRNKHGHRIQQYVTVTFLEHNAAMVLKGPAAKSKQRRGKK